MYETQGRLPWVIRGTQPEREMGEEVGRQKFAFIVELCSQQRFVSFYFAWAKTIIVSAEGGLTRYSVELGCLSSAVLDKRMLTCAGNIPETVSTIFSFQ